MDALTDRDLVVRREALWVLGCAQQPQAIAALRARIDDPAAVGERDVCVRLIGELHWRDHLPRLRAWLADDREDPATHVACMTTLAAWGDVESRPAFAAAARSSDNIVRLAGAAALASLDRQPQATKP